VLVRRKLLLYIISLSQPKYTVDDHDSARPDHQSGDIKQINQDSAKDTVNNKLQTAYRFKHNTSNSLK